MSSIPGSGRSPGGGNGNPLQYSCLENPRDRGAWWAIVQGVTKSWTLLSTWPLLRLKSSLEHLTRLRTQGYVCCCCSVAKSHPTLCHSMDCSTPGSSVFYYLPEFAQIHVHWVHSCPLSQWCYLTVSSSAVPFSFCLKSFPASGTFPMTCLFTSGSQSIGAPASVLPMNIQGWLPLGLNLPAMPETEISSLGQEHPLEKRKATHSSSCLETIPWTEEPRRLQSMG